MNVRVSREGARGCGFRKPGGLYLRCEGRGRPCGLLPIPLTVCPCCGGGIKFTRGWTWVDVSKLASMKKEGCLAGIECGSCPMADARISKAGLIWIGKQFYETPEEWMREADEMGISRRIKSVPKDFVLGETWVAVAHVEAIPGSAHPVETKPTPGIFRLFRPTGIEYVVRGDETEEELEALVKRGIEPVKVIPVRDQGEMFEETDEEIEEDAAEE